VCFHCHGTSSYHTTNTLQGRRAKSHVDTQTIQPGLGDFVLWTPYRPMPHFPSATKSWRRHWIWAALTVCDEWRVDGTLSRKEGRKEGRARVCWSIGLPAVASVTDNSRQQQQQQQQMQ